MRGVFLFLFSLLTTLLSYSQCVPISAGKDVSICRGEQIQLNATGASTYTWFPASGLNDPNISNPIASPLSSATYVVTTPFKSGNTTINGDFSAGYTGFISKYEYVSSPAPKALWQQGTFSIGLNPKSYHSNWGSYGDHTTGSGNYLICNGAGTPNVIVWEQEIKVCPNTEYSFSCWAISLASPPAILQFSINNILMAPVFATPNSIGVWEEYSTSWYSGSNTTAVIRIINQNQNAGGNDFGLDDIFFESKGLSWDSVTVTVHQPPVINANPIGICAGDTGTLSASGADKYTWSPAAGLSATSGPAVKAFPTTTTTYTITGSNQSGCSNTTTVSVAVGPPPIVTVYPISICAGDTGTLSASGADKYTWSPAAGLSTTSGPAVKAFPITTTTYTITGSNQSGCSNTTTVSVNVNPLPIVTVYPISICAGDTGTLSASGADKYTWSPAAGLSTTSGPAVKAFPIATTTYTITGSNQPGCSNTTTVSVTVNPLPIITSDPISICAGDTGTLSASGADQYTWSPAAGLSTTSGPAVKVFPITTTTYTITGSNQSGCSNTTTVSVTVNPLPIITSDPISICAGDTGTLFARGAHQYTWSPGMGLSATSGASVKAFPTATTTYTVTGSDQSGCSNSTTVSVTVKSCGITVTASGGTICLNECTTITATPNGGILPYSYSWQPGNLSGPSHRVCPTESTTYTVTATDGNGYTATATALVKVNPVPAVTAMATPICSGNEATLTASGASAYSWSGGTKPATGSTVTANPTTASTYTVLGTNSFGCTNTATARVNVESLPVITATGGTRCAGSNQSVTLNAGGADSYSWSTGSQAPSIEVSPATTTSYTVVGFSKTGCSGSASSVVTVYPLPKADFSISPQPANIFNANIHFKDLSSGSPLAWYWTFWDHLKDKPLKSDLQNPLPYQYNDTGSYQVQLAIVNQYGCRDSISKFVIIGPDWSFYIPNSFSPNEDGLNDGFIGKSRNIIEHQMWIFDRWGNMVYTTGKTKDPESAVPWNGKSHQGTDISPINSYAWVVVLKDIFGRNHKYTGHVTLIK